ncbi:hypothetical protein C8P68_104339 [Mucilaginibacter yixingensis]|uniref:Uncharacterized protein n=2 Tax=Mucilaginibacter yixingensis TaxID=1295612 RepID=A0A2T5J9W7_9SPHI|nr:hypothetical protein C8P68_104339 [Mucilaginibacter yixingensis]
MAFYAFAILMNGAEAVMQFYTYHSPLIPENVPWLLARPYIISVLLYGIVLGIIVVLYRRQNYSKAITIGIPLYIVLALLAYL